MHRQYYSLSCTPMLWAISVDFLVLSFPTSLSLGGSVHTSIHTSHSYMLCSLHQRAFYCRFVRYYFSCMFILRTPDWTSTIGLIFFVMLCCSVLNYTLLDHLWAMLADQQNPVIIRRNREYRNRKYLVVCSAQSHFCGMRSTLAQINPNISQLWLNSTRLKSIKNNNRSRLKSIQAQINPTIFSIMDFSIHFINSTFGRWI